MEITPFIRRDSNFYFFVEIYCSQLELLPHLHAGACVGGNKGSNLWREQSITEEEGTETCC